MKNMVLPFVLLSIIILSSCAGSESSKIVADFGSSHIEESLFRQEMQLQTYFVRLEIEQEHGVRLGGGLEEWNEKYEDVTPLSLVKQYAIESAVHAKSVLILAYEHKILKTDNFDKISADYADAFRESPGSAEAFGQDDEWRYSAFMDSVTDLLKKSMRENVKDSDIKAFIEEMGSDYLSGYIRIGSAEKEDIALLVEGVCGDERRRGVILDLMQDSLLEAQVTKMLDLNRVTVRHEVYDAQLPDFFATAG